MLMIISTLGVDPSDPLFLFWGPLSQERDPSRAGAIIGAASPYVFPRVMIADLRPDADCTVQV